MLEEGVPWERGRSRRLRRENGRGGAGPESSRPPARGPCRRRERRSGHRRYRRVKATKRRGTDGGKSEHCIVPMKPGNQPQGPGGGKADAGALDL